LLSLETQHLHAELLRRQSALEPIVELAVVTLLAGFNASGNILAYRVAIGMRTTGSKQPSAKAQKPAAAGGVDALLPHDRLQGLALRTAEQIA
jgi:hypothetical protein